MASHLSHLLLLALTAFLLSHAAAQSPSAPAPSPATLNITGILDKAGQYKIFIHLLTIETQVATQLANQLNTSTEGLTVFAPVDNAFNALKAGTINSLSTQQQVELLLYHVLPKFYALDSLLTVSNPVRTQANYGLNFTGQGSQVNVSTGMVQTQINNALYSDFPLAIYQVDKVLLAPQLFEPPAPATSPPAPSSKVNETATAKGPSASDSGAGAMNMWLSLVVGGVSICMAMGLLS